MSSNIGWKVHGCFTEAPNFAQSKAFKFPPIFDNRTILACEDDGLGLDHFDPTHPSFVFLSHVLWARAAYPVLVDGLEINTLNRNYKNATNFTDYMTSVSKQYHPQQLLLNTTVVADSDALMWMLYSNYNQSYTYTGSCHTNLTDGIMSPFPVNTTVKNIFPPYDTITLTTANITGYGCLTSLSMSAGFWFGAYVEVSKWVRPPPRVVGFSPGHDQRLMYNATDAASSGGMQSVPVTLTFSAEMDCQSVTAAVSFSGYPTAPGGLDPNVAVSCGATSLTPALYHGTTTGVWQWSASLLLAEGTAEITVGTGANSTDGDLLAAPITVMLRLGSARNPLVFGGTDMYDQQLVQQSGGNLVLAHAAAGAEMFRVSFNFMRNFTTWQNYTGNPSTLDASQFDAGAKQVAVQINSDNNAVAESSAARFGSLGIYGDFNLFGLDKFVRNMFAHTGNGIWQLPLMLSTDASIYFMTNDVAMYGDFDNDSVLDRQDPSSLAGITYYIPQPATGYASWLVGVNDRTRIVFLQPFTPTYTLWALYAAYAVGPVLFAIVAFFAYKVNYGIRHVRGEGKALLQFPDAVQTLMSPAVKPYTGGSGRMPAEYREGKRLKMLMGTLEYKIPEWGVKVQIGGLGVIANIFAEHYTNEADLIWVIPRVGDVEFPEGQGHADLPIPVTIFGKVLIVDVLRYVRGPVTFYILDADVFRKNIKANPYPSRMDDVESITFYSAWNQCIAAIAMRSNPDVMHIQDYHGAVAPLYLLPATIPCAMSLHNAEFQGQWPCRDAKERETLAAALNLPVEVLKAYLIMGSTVNFVHAGAVYISRHQRSYGVIGVSDVYAGRAYKRYAALWTLWKGVQGLNNPNPGDVGAAPVEIERVDEAKRAKDKKFAQEWAGLTVDPEADLLVFVGRWSYQKGVDMIADLTPKIFKEFPRAQMICIGPTIDMYGRFAAIKLEKLMQEYPGRLFSKPEFTQIPPEIFSATDFVLIPSRDEPFGLVSVEFGRKGALGIGSLLGGLGKMPGWWYPVESSETPHLYRQFLMSVRQALRSTQTERTQMREVSRKQRFAVEEWVQQTKVLHMGVIQAAYDGKKNAEKVAEFKSIAEREEAYAESVRSGSFGVTTPGGSGSDADAPPPLPRISSFASLAPSTSGPPTPGPTPQLLPPEPSLQLRHRVPSNSTLSPGLSRSGNRSSVALWSMGELSPGLVVGRISVAGGSVGGGMSSRQTGSTPASTNSDAAVSEASDNDDDGESVSVLEITSRRLREELQPADLFDPTATYGFLKTEAYFNDQDGALEKEFKEMMNRLGGGAGKKMSPEASIGVLSIDAVLVKGRRKYYHKTWREEYDSAKNLIARAVQYRFGNWPVYVFILAFGQLIAANSYQIVLLTGNSTYSDLFFYIVGGIFVGGTVVWCLLFRWLRSYQLLSLPFIVYGVAFLLATQSWRGLWFENSAIWLYTFASSSGPLYLFLNFGEDVGTFTYVWA
ncbi:Cell wall alpha-1,3-glucan synthase ags1, partial [Cladochytrium tenue]